MRHGRSTGVSDISSEVLLKVGADSHAGDGVESGERTRFRQMTFLETIRANGFGTRNASVTRLPAIGAERVLGVVYWRFDGGGCP